jgi:hypothetical protein
MKTFDYRFLAIIFSLFAAVFFLGNSSGPAFTASNYYTGAPSTGGGTEGTCNTCHNSGAGTYGEPVINVSFAVGDSVVDLTAYVPGQTYRVTVAIGDGSDTAPAAYGFSSQFVNEAAMPVVNAGTLANPDQSSRIADAANGRQYAEHNSANADSTFTFEWTAPMAGEGEIKYYVAGNLVDGFGSPGGDSGSTAPTIVTLAEGSPSGTRNFAAIEHALFPNPTNGEATLRVTPASAGSYQLNLMTLDGRVLRSQTHNLTAGTTALDVPANALKPGIYVVQLMGFDSQLVTRLVVR